MSSRVRAQQERALGRCGGRVILYLLCPGDSGLREMIALGNLGLVVTCPFAFYFIFLLTKYGYFLPSVDMERNEEQI